MLRSIGAIVAGFVLIAVLAFGADALVISAFPEKFAPNGGTSDPVMLGFMTLYVAVFAIFGCYVAARLAPSRPMRHALILGALGLVFNIVAAISLWGTMPAWYSILNLLLVMPYAWVGGQLRERQLVAAGHAPAQEMTVGARAS
jgi:hypothetical protein